MPASPGARVTAVLFDLDGTLTDREASVRAFGPALRAALGPRLGSIDADRLADLLVHCDRNGYNPQLARDLRDALPWQGEPPPVDRLREIWVTGFADRVVLRPDALALLDGLRARGVAIGLVTNGGSPVQRRKLEVTQLGARFGAIVVSAEVGMEKPDARIFALALERLGVPAAGAWFVGDHPEKDVRGAEAAGLRAVWIRGLTPWPPDGPLPRHAIEQLRELPLLLERAGA